MEPKDPSNSWASIEAPERKDMMVDPLVDDSSNSEPSIEAPEKEGKIVDSLKKAFEKKAN